MDVRTAIKTKPLTKTHSTSFEAGNVGPGQADCNKTTSSSCGRHGHHQDEACKVRGRVDLAPVPPTTLVMWPGTSHSRHRALRINEWFTSWWLILLLSEFSETMAKRRIQGSSWWCCLVLSCCYLKREPQLCGRECDAGCKPPSEMKDLFPSLLRMLPETKPQLQNRSFWPNATFPVKNMGAP